MYSVLPSVFFVLVTLFMCMSSIWSFLKPISYCRNSTAVFMSVFFHGFTFVSFNVLRSYWEYSNYVFWSFHDFFCSEVVIFNLCLMFCAWCCVGCSDCSIVGGFGDDLMASAYVRCFPRFSTFWPWSLILRSWLLMRLFMVSILVPRFASSLVCIASSISLNTSTPMVASSVQLILEWTDPEDCLVIW